MSGDERGRGILTPADREFLRNPEDYSRQAAYNRNEAIKERVENSTLDFMLLARELDAGVYEDLFSAKREAVDDGVVSTIPEGNLGTPFGVMFLIRVALADRLRMNDPRFGVQNALSPFINNVENGIDMFLNYQHGLRGDVDVSVSVENLSTVDGYAEQLDERDEPVTGFERIEATSQLSRAGYSPEEIGELLGEQPEPEDYDKYTEDVPHDGDTDQSSR